MSHLTRQEPTVSPATVTEYDKDSAPDVVLSFEKRWEDVLGNVSSPALLQNWNNNFDAFDEIIDRNMNGGSVKKICCPSPTGSGKTQQIIHKAIDLFKSKVGTLIVTMRTEDADIIASQIKTHTHDDYVAVYHSKDVSIVGVRKAEEPLDAQCLVITHEMFRRKESSITERREFIVIDEAIDVITHRQVDKIDVENILKILKQKRNMTYKGRDGKMLLAEIDQLQEIIDVQFKALDDIDYKFNGCKVNDETIEMSKRPQMRFEQAKKILSIESLKPSIMLTGYQNDHIDSAVKKKLLGVCSNMHLFFNQFSFMSKNGYQMSWSIADELIPSKSVIVMDATASVNKAYEFYMKYQPERLEVLPAIKCRDYSNVTIHTARTATGRNTILGKENSEATKVKNNSAKTLSNIIMKSTEPGDDILVVTFKELEPTIITYAESVEDRRIRVDHWGNLTGTNKYNACNKIIIYGLNHKPQEMHRSMHALIKSPEKALLHTTENKMEFNELVRSDIVAEVIQAINRVRCRNVIDSDGNCEPTDVFLTLPAHYGSATEMMLAIKSEMHDIKEVEWTNSKEDVKTLERTSFLESFIMQLNVLLDKSVFEVKLQDVLDALYLNREQWRLNIKGHDNFEATMEASDFGMEMRHRTNRRGKKLKTLEPWFFRKKNE